MSYYTVYFRYVSNGGKLCKDHIRIDADNLEDAKKRVVRGEKPKLIAVDKIKKG